MAGVTLELLGEGRKLADELGTALGAVLLGSGMDRAAQELIAYGADRVYLADSPQLASFWRIPTPKCSPSYARSISPPFC